MGSNKLVAAATFHTVLWEGADFRASIFGSSSNFLDTSASRSLEGSDSSSLFDFSDNQNQQGEGPLKLPLGSNADVTHSKEGDKHMHQTNIGASDTSLHNFNMTWKLSKTMLLPWDVEEQRDHPMDDITVGLFPALVRVSLSYLFLFLFRLINVYMIN